MPDRPEALSSCATAEALRLPNRFTAYDRADRASLQFPAIKRSIARERFARFSPPFHFWIDQRDVGLRSTRQRGGIRQRDMMRTNLAGNLHSPCPRFAN